MLPLETVKTQMQVATKSGGMVDCAKRIVAADGVAGLWRGFVPFAVQTTGRTGIRFSAVTMLQKYVDQAGVDRASNPLLWSSLTGFGAGICEAVLWTTPTERLKVLQQVRTSGGEAPTVMSVLRTEGISGLWVGGAATTARQATSVMTRFAAYDQIKNAMAAVSGDSSTSSCQKLLAGGLAGAFSVAVNNPIDVVKTKLQAGVGGSRSSFGCFFHILRTQGVAALWAGTSVRVPRVFISQAMQFYIVETLTDKTLSLSVSERGGLLGLPSMLRGGVFRA